MTREIEDICLDLGQGKAFGILMGGAIDGWDYESMVGIWSISCVYIFEMYNSVLKSRNQRIIIDRTNVELPPPTPSPCLVKQELPPRHSL